MIALNKEDIIEDAEVVGEYKKQFLKQAHSYLQKTFKIKLTDKETPVFVMSAMTKSGMDARLDEIQHYLQYERQHTSMLLFDTVPIAAKPTGYIMEATQEIMPWLIEHGYVSELDAKYAKVREVQDAEFCRLAYMLPWGNDEAEIWFWNVMGKKRFVQKLESAGLVKGDIIKITSLYEGKEDKYIRY